MIAALRNGSWLTTARIRRVGMISAIVTIACLIWLFATANGTLDYAGRPIGTDFSNVWTAGAMALDGKATQVWDWPSHFHAQQALHNKPNIDFYGWHYPPPFLLVASALALLPYIPALIVWQASTLALAVATLRRIDASATAMIAALGAPVVLVCLTHGHNGFLTGALLGFGLLLLDRKPLLAGLLLGAMIYKPQFGLVLPVVLLAGMHARAITGAIVSALLLCGLTLLLWGPAVWDAFVASLPLTQSVVIEQGSTGWYKIQSIFSAARNWGMGINLAWAIQSIATLAALAGALFVARGAKAEVRNATVMIAALLSTPYLLDYDLVPLGLAIAMLVKDGRERGFLDWEKSVYALAWATPLLGRAVMQHAYIPLGAIAILAIFTLALRRAWRFDRKTIAAAWPQPGFMARRQFS